MKARILGMIIFTASIEGLAQAHPTDAPCPAGLHTEDGCQPVIKSLRLDNPEFFAAHRAYWHCRRELVTEDLMGLAKCVGGNVEKSNLLGEAYHPTDSEEALCEYWGLIPAHPELDELDSGDLGKNVSRANAQLDACELTRSVAGAVIAECERKAFDLSNRLFQQLNKKPVCPRRTRR